MAFLATALCVSPGLAADPGKPKGANGNGSVTTGGILTGQDQDSLTFLTDGEDTPVKYVYADSFDKKLLMITWPMSRFQVTFVKDGNARRLLSIKGERHLTKGTTTGVVIYGTDFWIAVKSRDGPMDAYASNWPPGDARQDAQGVAQGRHRCDSIPRRWPTVSYRRPGHGVEGTGAPAAILPAGVEAQFDVEYAKPDGLSLSLDVYRPKDVKGPLPLVVWIHGGAWMAGSKENPEWALKLVPHGYVVASINYRLSHEAIFPAQIHDCKAAIRFLLRQR